MAVQKWPRCLAAPSHDFGGSLRHQGLALLRGGLDSFVQPWTKETLYLSAFGINSVFPVLPRVGLSKLVTLWSICNEYFFQLDPELSIGDLRLENQRASLRAHPVLRNSVAYSVADD
jgi:hypothetical protein